MILTEYRCDRCQAKIDSGRARLVLEVGPPPPSWPRDPTIGRSTLDLSSTCFEALASLVAEGRSPSTSARQLSPHLLTEEPFH
jgi:hypothetical protein